MALILHLALAGGLVLLLATVLPAVTVKNYWHALLTAVLVAAGVWLAAIIRVPANFVTFGLMPSIISFAITVLVVWVVDKLLDGFKIKSFGWTVGFSLLFVIGDYIIARLLG